MLYWASQSRGFVFSSQTKNGFPNQSSLHDLKSLTFNSIGIWFDRTKQLVSVISDAFAPIFWVCHCWSEGFVCIILFQQGGGKLRKRGTRVAKKSRQCKLTILRISFCSTKLRNWKMEGKMFARNLRLLCWIGNDTEIHSHLAIN